MQYLWKLLNHIMMTEKVKQLLIAYSKLTKTEREAFDKAVREANDKLEKGALYESFETHVKRMIGPLGSGVCECCGK